MMFDYKQRPATDEYRENWERIFARNSEVILLDPTQCGEYVNGCPILDENLGTDQANGETA